MDIETAPIVIAPGLGGSSSQHWQSRWQVDLPTAVRISPASWEAPELEDWLIALDRAADEAGEGKPVLVVAHSLGCRAAALWSVRSPDRAAGLFCVAPPSVAGMTRAGVVGFDGADYVRPPVPVLLVASRDDPHADLTASRALGQAWSATVCDVGALGHIKDESNLGYWPQGLEVLRTFTAGL